ncbi:SUMF1/EgtB/PvdO family nonheme iron enzyme [Bradyrhizobium diazoefficiens]|nr:SUMF1/EgtB/PvdO family nonheme iron enzyme [Bradyrhizobium diazoefficiens]
MRLPTSSVRSSCPSCGLLQNSAAGFAACRYDCKRLRLSEPLLRQELPPVASGHCCNIWQGNFPDCNTVDDGYFGTPPVHSFAPNGYGLHNVAGNVWEWCEDYFSPIYDRLTPSRDPLNREPAPNRSMRGGSFLCHESYCNRYRVAARSSNTPDSSSSNIGFRVVRTEPLRDPA